jgi:K+-sensing histidine kinase KdpD
MRSSWVRMMLPPSAALAVALLVYAVHANATTAALLLIALVLVSALFFGSAAALFCSIVSFTLLNFLFIPPVYTFRIAGTENLVAILTFLGTALIVGQLSSRARTRAEEAEANRRRAEDLYHQLKQANEQVAESEILRRSEQVKSAILDAVTHDLKTPLTSIKAAATTLLANVDSSIGDRSSQQQMRDLMTVIDEETDRLNRFIDAMVELARIQSGAIAPAEEPVSMQEIIEVAMARAVNILAKHRVQVRADEELPLLRVNPEAIAEVVYVLLENAAKYSNPYSFIHLAARQTSEDEVEVSVEDEGIGIPEDARDKVFERFFRVGHREGSGMGLAIARGLVELHGGSIWVEGRRNGRGAAFKFRLPVRQHA